MWTLHPTDDRPSGVLSEHHLHVPCVSRGPLPTDTRSPHGFTRRVPCRSIYGGLWTTGPGECTQYPVDDSSSTWTTCVQFSGLISSMSSLTTSIPLTLISSFQVHWNIIITTNSSVPYAHCLSTPRPRPKKKKKTVCGIYSLLCEQLHRRNSPDPWGAKYKEYIDCKHSSSSGSPSTGPRSCVWRTIPLNAGYRRSSTSTATALPTTTTEATKYPPSFLFSCPILSMTSPVMWRPGHHQSVDKSPRRQSKRLKMFQSLTPGGKNFLPPYQIHCPLVSGSAYYLLYWSIFHDCCITSAFSPIH